MQPNNQQAGGQFSAGQPPQPYKPKKSSGLLIPLIIMSVIAVVFLALFVWAFMERQDYKNNVDSKITQAVKVAVEQESQRKDNEFIEKEKLPNKTFKGSDTFGAVQFDYPKTWSAYVEESGRGSTPLDTYFHPNYVPALNGDTAFALRAKVIDKSYDQYLSTFQSKIKQGKVKAKVFKPQNQPNVAGTRLDGEVNSGQQNSVIVLPLRDKTIEISTEASQFKGDFDAIIKTLNFTP